MSAEPKESVERIFECSSDSPHQITAPNLVLQRTPSLDNLSKEDLHGSDSMERRVLKVRFPEQLIELFTNRLTGNRKTSEHIEYDRPQLDKSSNDTGKKELERVDAPSKEKSNLSSIAEEYQDDFDFDSPQLIKKMSKKKDKEPVPHRFCSQQVLLDPKPKLALKANGFKARPSNKQGKSVQFLVAPEQPSTPPQNKNRVSSIRVREARTPSVHQAVTPAVQTSPAAPTKTQARIFGFLMVFCYCMMIVISKFSKSRGVELAFVRGVTGLMFSFIYNKFNPEPFYFREGYVMEKFMLRGFLGALTFTLQMTANQLLNSAIFIVMSRMKVFFTLILNTLFNSDVINFKLILLTVVAFIGVCLVMDPSIFGFPSLSDPEAIRIVGLPREIVAIGLCVVYMIISSVARAFMVYATIEMNNTQAFFFLSIFNIINSSVVFVWEPMVWRTDEIIIYIAISVTSILFIYAFLFFLTYEQDMLIFIMIQTSIVGMTFMIDITLFGTQFNAYNLLGVILVIGASFSV